MQLCSRPLSRFVKGMLLALLLSPSSGRAAVTVGGIALIGYTDDAATDSLSVVVLETIAAGEKVYFTNNGWINSSRTFDGASQTGEFGAGAEQLMMVNFLQSVSAGTILSSATSTAEYVWTTSGLIPTGNVANTQEFSALNLKHEGVYNDEVYIFQASDANPLLNVTRFLYAIDMGAPAQSPTGFDVIAGAGQGGEVPNGEVSVDGGLSYFTVPTVDLNGQTAMELNPDGSPTMDFFGGTFGLDLSAPEVVNLQMEGGTREEWLVVIANRENWSSLSAQPSGNLFYATPEPSRAVLLLVGGLSAFLRRRRKCE